MPGPGGLASSSAEGSAALRVALVGPTRVGRGAQRALVEHTIALAGQLRLAGHDVHLESSPGPAHAHRWAQAGRRLRTVDALVLVHEGARSGAGLLALLQAAGSGPRTVLVVDRVGGATGRAVGRLAHRSVERSLMARASGVLVHRPGEAGLAADLGARVVYAVPRPRRLAGVPEPVTATSPLPHAVVGGSLRGGSRIVGPVEPAGAIASAEATGATKATKATGAATEVGLDGPWADYVGAIEALAAGVAATDATLDTGLDTGEAVQQAWPAVDWAREPLGRVHALLRQSVQARRGARRRVGLTRADLPEWVRPTDVLGDDGGLDQAREARAEARRLGLPRCGGPIEAWAALGALAAVVRVTDDGLRAAVIVDESGPRSPLSRWLRAVGYAPVDLGLTSDEADQALVPDVDAGTIDVVARIHPGGCDRDDIEETLAAGAWALRNGGLLVLTLPLGLPGTPGAVVPADVRGLVATAHEAGFVLVGDLDGPVGQRMRAASVDAQVDAEIAAVADAGRLRPHGERSATGGPGSGGDVRETTAYGLVRLTFRRR